MEKQAEAEEAEWSDYDHIGLSLFQNQRNPNYQANFRFVNFDQLGTSECRWYFKPLQIEPTIGSII
jgi:hypothetical protein